MDGWTSAAAHQVDNVNQGSVFHTPAVGVWEPVRQNRVCFMSNL